MLGAWIDDEIGPVLRAVVLTAAHDERTREKLRMVVERSLIGFALLRFVWKIEPVASMSEDEVVAAVAPNIHRYIEGDV
jgi:hypothetical protein